MAAPFACRRRASAAVLSILVLATGCGGSDNGGAVGIGRGQAPLRPGATTVPAGATVLTADLTAAEEVPGPGATGAGGTARLVLSADGQVCAGITTTKGLTATAAHVHTGDRGVAGPVVVTLPTPTDGRADACVRSDPAVVARVAAEPASAYVNVHTQAQPTGAVRGQLSRP